MIKVLRKRHLQFWLLLLVLIPAGIISAYLVLPFQHTGILLQPASPAALPILIKTVEKDGYTINLRGTGINDVEQLEWISKKELTTPSAMIYEDSTESGTTGAYRIIGSINERGIYRFPIQKASLNNQLHLILFDVIHREVIDRINF